MEAKRDDHVLQSFQDLLEAEMTCIFEILKARRDVAPFFVYDGLSPFKASLKAFIQEGLQLYGDVRDFEMCGMASQPWQFSQELRDELVLIIITGFQQPLSLGDDVFLAVEDHLKRKLKEGGMHVFEQLWDLLASKLKQREEGQEARRMKKMAATKAKARSKSAGKSSKGRGKGHGKTTSQAASESKASHPDPEHAVNKSQNDSKDSIPKAPDCADIIAMAGRLVPQMDVESVREVQSMVSTDLREIIAEARHLGYKEPTLDTEASKAIHFQWMLFCHKQGSQQKAEDAVLARLRKKVPWLALMLYGPAALIEVDARGLRVQSKKSNAADDYLALDAAMQRTTGKQTNQCGVSGLLTAVFGEFDYPALVTELLTNLSPSAKQSLIKSLGEVGEKVLAELGQNLEQTPAAVKDK